MEIPTIFINKVSGETEFEPATSAHKMLWRVGFILAKKLGFFNLACKLS